MNFLSDIELAADEYEANMADLDADRAANPDDYTADMVADDADDSFARFLALTDERVPA